VPDPRAGRAAAPRRLELYLCVAAAVALILLRTSMFFSELFFDSDQAIVGLMAKHLSEGRAFPLFFYGQSYMLGVQAWMAAPFFRIGGPTVAMLRTPLVLISIAVAVGLLAAFVRRGVRPVFALAAIAPFVATMPAVSDELIRALGVSVEPFFYVLVLWTLRRHPWWCGAFLCLATLHREFTIFALPPLLLVVWLENPRIRWAPLVKGAVAFAAVWVAIDIVKLHVNTLGALGTPGGNTPLTDEARLVGGELALQPSVYLATLREAVTIGLPRMWSIATLPLAGYGLESRMGEWSWLAALVFGAASALCVSRLAFSMPALVRNTELRREMLFPAYLAVIGAEMVLAYGLSGRHYGSPTLAYLLLVILLPIALFGAYFQAETRPPIAWLVTCLLAVYAAVNITDTARVTREVIARPPVNERRVLADYLRAHRIKYGWAIYWDCYAVDFLSRERVLLASYDTVRIPGYQRIVEQNRASAANVDRLPCTGGDVVASWCVRMPSGH
jgi:hypothetical protein